MKEGKKTTSIKIDPELWKEVKMYCLKNDTEVSEFVEKILKRAVQKPNQ